MRKFKYGLAELQDQVGVVTGLAYTSAGGDLLQIEALKLPGKGRMKTTGTLGDVMKESLEGSSELGIGSGSTLLGVSRLYTQGAMVGTGNNLDLAISGEGFFVVNATKGVDDVTLAYTRAGQFHIDGLVEHGL